MKEEKKEKVKEAVEVVEEVVVELVKAPFKIVSKLAKQFTQEKLIRFLADLQAIDLRLKTTEEPPKLLLSLFLQKLKI